MRTKTVAVAAALGRRLLALGGLLLLLPTTSTFGHGGYHERMAYLTAEVEKNPGDPLLYFELGNLHGEHGDLELALQNLERVDALAPGRFVTDLARGNACLVAGKFTQAKEALDRQLVTHPENPRAWLLRARAERKLGQDEASLVDFREAFKRTPSLDPDIVQEVADALATRGHQEEAAQVLATGIEKLGKIPSLVLRAVDLEIAMKNIEAALRRIEDARRDAPRPEPWMARRAIVLAQAGRIDESREAWKALAEHLDSLPEGERASAAMTNLAEETRQALASLRPISAAQQSSSSNPASPGK